MRTRSWLMLLCGVLAVPGVASAQADLQLWGNFTLDWVTDKRLTYELDIEPKVLISAPEGGPGWYCVEATPTLEHATASWLDLIAETAVSRTKQTDDLDTFEITPRAGLRLHVFSRDIRSGRRIRELPPKRRVVVRDLVRVEWRNLYYGGSGSGSDHAVRLRNRLEFLAALNREQLTEDRTRYVLADWEWFVPLDDPAERFANKQRIRAGLGYRRTYAWRFETLYMWTRSRNTIEEGFKTDDHSIDIRVKRVF